MNQYIWGNRFIKYSKNKGKSITLYFQSFTNVGINRVSDLLFIDGTVDESYLYGKIKDKRNILTQITPLRKTLKPYKLLIGDHTPKYVHTMQNNANEHIINVKS